MSVSQRQSITQKGVHAHSLTAGSAITGFSGSFFHPQPLSLLILLSEPGSERKVLTKETWFSLVREWKSLETAAGAVFVPTRFSLVRTSIRDQVADGNSLVRNSGVGGGGQNLILSFCSIWGKKMAWGKRSLVGELNNFPSSRKSPFSPNPSFPGKTVHSKGKGKLFSRENYPSEGNFSLWGKIRPIFPWRENFAPKDV